MAALHPERRASGVTGAQGHFQLACRTKPENPADQGKFAK
jgi:hypothetical protein